MTGSADIIQLRKLLFGDNYDALLQLRERYEDHEAFSTHVSQVISEAIKKRLDTDQSFPKTLSPLIEQMLIESIYNNPKKIADVLYPVMGPAIRKSIYQTLADSMAQLNQMLEHSLSIRALRWRFDAWRTGQSYAHIMMMNTLEYQVEQVFLIHKDNGLLLQHLQAEHALTNDPDMVSGMLTAIQDFIKDSFDVDHDDNLRQMRLGELTVQMEHGPRAVIACVIRGHVPNYFNDLLSDTLEEIHQNFGQEFEGYNGDTAAFSRSESWLRSCLTKQEQRTATKKSSPKLLSIIIATLLGLAAFSFYQNYQKQQQWETVLNELEQAPGLVILDKAQTYNGYKIDALIDPLADDPKKIIQQHDITRDITTLNLTPYLSMDQEMLSRRAKQKLIPPDGVLSTLHDDAILYIRGTAHETWVDQLNQNWRFVAGLKGINTEQLKVIPAEVAVVVDTRSQQSQALIRGIEQSKFFFDVKATALANQEHQIQQLAQSIIELLRLTNSLQQSLQIQIIGNTDQTGSLQENRKLRTKRETYIKHALIQSGVPSFILVSQSQYNQQEINIENERSIRFQIRVY